MKLTRIEKFKVGHISFMNNNEVYNLIRNFKKLSNEDKKYVIDMMNKNYEKQLNKYQTIKQKVEGKNFATKTASRIDDNKHLESELILGCGFISALSIIPAGLISNAYSSSNTLVTAIMTISVFSLLCTITAFAKNDGVKIYKHPYAMHLYHNMQKNEKIKYCLAKEFASYNNAEISEQDK